MYADSGYQLILLVNGLIVGAQVGLMLEIVGVQLTVSNSGVGQRILGEDLDLQLITQSGHVFLDELQHLSVRRRGSTDDDLGQTFSKTAGGQRCNQYDGQNQGQYALHSGVPP